MGVRHWTRMRPQEAATDGPSHFARQTAAGKAVSGIARQSRSTRDCSGNHALRSVRAQRHRLHHQPRCRGDRARATSARGPAGSGAAAQHRPEPRTAGTARAAIGVGGYDPTHRYLLHWPPGTTIAVGHAPGQPCPASAPASSPSAAAPRAPRSCSATWVPILGAEGSGGLVDPQGTAAAGRGPARRRTAARPAGDWPPPPPAPSCP